nr:hypothetical protein [Fibrobacter sp.]
MVYRIHDRSPVFERRTQTRNDVVVDIRDLQEFLKIKREHFYRGHVAHRRRIKIRQFHSKERSAQDISETPFFLKELDFGNHLLVFLDFVNEDDCLASFQFLYAKSRKNQNKVIDCFRSGKNIYRGRGLYEVYLKEIRVFCR